ncbi:MAG: CPBP family intramembrane metalloprotease [Eubacterium sp.]|nr:CPBP family intramembrane metalloprotease [Eubacterium sp.]
MKKRERVTIGHLWGAFYPTIMYLLITVIAGIILVLVEKRVIVENGSINIEAIDQNMSLIITFFGALITAPLLIVIKYYDVKKQRMIGAYGYKSEFFLKYLLIIPFAVTFMYAANMLVTIVEKLLPSIAHSFDETAKAIYGANIAIQIITAVILGPIVEELIFRGLMYIRLKRMFGTGVAAFVTGLIFGLYHGNVSQGIYAFVFSYGAIFIYEKYKKIYAPIIMHMVANGVSVLVSFVLKDYNTSTGSATASISEKTEWASTILVFALSVALCAVFALLIKKCVHPRKK